MERKAADNLGVLLRSYEALYNWRALVMLAGSFAVAGLIVIGALDLASGGAARAVLAILLGLVALAVAIVGVNASGLMLTDQAYDRPSRSLAGAFLGALQVTLAAIGVLVLLGIGYALVFIGVFLLSLLARIPGIGGVFAFVLSGPSVLLLAMTMAVLVLAAPLALAGLWHGDGLMESLMRAVTIVVKRPLDVFMRFLVLALIVMPAALFLFAMISLGDMSVAGMYLMDAMRSMSGTYATMGGGSQGGMGITGMAASFGSLIGHGMGAAGVSSALVWYLAFGVVGLIHLLGVILIYESVSEGVGLDGLDVLRQRARRITVKTGGQPPVSDGPHAPS